MRKLVFVVVPLLAAGCAEEAPTNVLRVSGHVEATETRLAPETGGRILELHVKEGDRIDRGALVLTLDTRDAELALDRARAERAQAEAQLRLLQAGARHEDIRQAEAQAESARADAAALDVEVAAGRQDLARFEQLVAANAGSRKQRDDAAVRVALAEERLKAAVARVAAADAAVARLRAGARPEELQAARARVAALSAQIAALEKTLGDATFHAPVGGVVTTRLAEPGEVLLPRAPVAIVVDLDRAWADVFVPEPAVPRLRLGQTATLFTDAGGPGIPGTISFVSPTAEFTPRNVQTADERAQLVYRVRVAVDNREGVLKQGMPVEAEIPLQP